MADDSVDPVDSVDSASQSSGSPPSRSDLSLPLQRYRLTIAYDGTLFHGWQKQQPPDAVALRTVAGVIEDALTRLLRQPINLRGASRTDAGVHARGQAAVFDAHCPIPLDRLKLAINSRLPADIDIMNVEIVPDHFNFIHDVVSKQYRYRMFCSPQRPLDRRHHTWHCWLKLDIDKMRDAAERLVGEHDFAGLAAAGHGRETTIRTIHHCEIERAGDETHIIVAGSGFLYNMVRIIAGTLVEVGREHFKPDVIDEVIATGNRRLAGPTLPPTGLWLEWIRYREDVQTNLPSEPRA